MEPRQAIRTCIAASVIAHLAVLTLMLMFGEVHSFGSDAESIAVNVVTAEEATAKQAEPPLAPEAKPLDPVEPAAQPAAELPVPAAVPPEAVTRPQEQAPRSPTPDSKMAAAPPPSTPASTPPSQAYRPPEPDLSVKYHVMLGLPPDIVPNAPPAGSGDKAADAFDGPASQQADIASGLVAEFRRHLRTCLRLPQSITPSDRLKIKLRVFMSPEGRLAAEPVLIEASASAKGPALMQGAIGALQACQPYAMLPADRYGEWKVLDLSFTPQDFSS